MADTPERPGALATVPPLRRTVGLGVVIGAANALGLLGFEWLTDHLTNLIWNDWAGSDEVRWLVVPLAIAGSVALSLTVRATRQTRMQPPHTDVLAQADEMKPSSLRSIAVLLTVGAVSLVGGASLRRRRRTPRARTRHAPSGPQAQTLILILDGGNRLGCSLL